MTSLPSHGTRNVIFASLVGVQKPMRCISILEICLLAYLALSIHSLGRSLRGRVFGLGLGFGLQACGELISSGLLARHAAIWSWSNLFLESISIGALLV